MESNLKVNYSTSKQPVLLWETNTEIAPQYLKIWADYASTGLFFDFGKQIRKDETTLSDNLWDKLQKWVTDYEFVILLNSEQRTQIKEQIESLDKRGIELTKKIRNELKIKNIDNSFPLKYFSEGFMKFIDIE